MSIETKAPVDLQRIVTLPPVMVVRSLFEEQDAEKVAAIVEPIMTAHINAPEPHPAYDDMPSLTLLFENGLI